MNSPEFMCGTNRVVIKAKDNSKVIITRDYVNEELMYMVKFTSDISYALTDVAKECGYLVVLHGISIDEDVVTIEGTLMENIALKEDYHIVNGCEFGKFTETFIPFPEETTRLIPFTVCCDEIKEMTGDLDMLQDMSDENILSATTADLINLGIIINPQFEVIGSGNKKNEETFPGPISPSLLTIINGRDKVRKKQ